MELRDYDIDTLIIRKLSGQISTEENEWLTQHMDTDLEVRESFEVAKEIWISTEQLRVKGNLSAEQRFLKLQTRIQEEEGSRPTRLWLRYAAVLVMLIVAGAGYWIFKPDTRLHLKGIAGEVNTFDLPDGSTVSVNGSSSISYYPESFLKNREIELDGEAYFRVKPGRVPFVVNTQQARVTVLGTSFNIHTYERQTEVECITGKVRVSERDDEDVTAELTKGLGVRVAQELSTVYAVNESDVMAWTRGELQFKENRLHDVFATLEKHFGKSIQYSGSLLEVTFSGKFLKPQLEDVLETVCLSAGLTYRIGADSVIIIQEK